MWYVVLDDGDTFGAAKGAWLLHVPKDKDEAGEFDRARDVIDAADGEVSLAELVRMLDKAAGPRGRRT